MWAIIFYRKPVCVRWMYLPQKGNANIYIYINNPYYLKNDKKCWVRSNEILTWKCKNLFFSICLKIFCDFLSIFIFVKIFKQNFHNFWSFISFQIFSLFQYFSYVFNIFQMCFHKNLTLFFQFLWFYLYMLPSRTYFCASADESSVTSLSPLWIWNEPNLGMLFYFTPEGTWTHNPFDGIENRKWPPLTDNGSTASCLQAQDSHRQRSLPAVQEKEIMDLGRMPSHHQSQRFLATAKASWIGHTHAHTPSLQQKILRKNRSASL